MTFKQWFIARFGKHACPLGRLAGRLTTACETREPQKRRRHDTQTGREIPAGYPQPRRGF